MSHWEISKLRNSKDLELELECIDSDDKVLLEEILRKVLNEESWIPFRYPVDFSEYPEYYAVVPYPIYTELIYKRLKNNYYRQNSVIISINIILQLTIFLELHVGYKSNKC